MSFDQVVNGVPLVLVVMGLVELAKLLGLSGRWLTLFSCGLGLVFGLAYQMSLGMPTGFGAWFGAVMFGLGLGLVACKVYDAIGSATRKGAE